MWYLCSVSRKPNNNSSTLPICAGVLGCLFTLVIAIVVVMFVAPFRGLIGARSAGHPIYADGVFDFILYDADDLGVRRL